MYMPPEQAKPLFEKMLKDVETGNTAEADELAQKYALEEATAKRAKPADARIVHKMSEGIPLKAEPEEDYLRRWEKENQ